MQFSGQIRGGLQLETKLRALPQKIARRDGGNALKRGAELIAEEARRLAPVSDRNEEHLRDNIVVSLLRASKGAARRVVIGFNKAVSFRAHFTEYGTYRSKPSPFMRPALDGKGAEAIERIGEELWNAVSTSAEE